MTVRKLVQRLLQLNLDAQVYTDIQADSCGCAYGRIKGVKYAKNGYNKPIPDMVEITTTRAAGPL